MTDQFPSLLQQARTRIGMDERAAARIFGLSLCEYADLEAYPDEWFSVLPTQVIRCVVSCFGIDWRSCRTWNAGKVHVGPEPLNSFLVKIREAHALTREQFADRGSGDCDP